MPVVLAPESWAAGEEPADPSELRGLLTPYPSEEMIVWASARVNSVKKQGSQPY